MKSVYSAVRTGSLDKAVCVSSLKGSDILVLSFTHTPSCRSPRLHFYFTNHSSPLVVDTNCLLQGCINPRCQAAQTKNVVTWRPYTCRSYVTFLATRILKWLPDFWKMCAPLAYRHSFPATPQSDNDRIDCQYKSIHNTREATKR